MTSLRHILLALVTLTALGTSPSVRASSPDAWAVQRAEVVAKCKQASGLKRIGISNGLWEARLTRMCPIGVVLDGLELASAPLSCPDSAGPFGSMGAR